MKRTRIKKPPVAVASGSNQPEISKEAEVEGKKGISV